MKEIENERTKTIASKDPDEFDHIFAKASDELAKYKPDVNCFVKGEEFCAQFRYAQDSKIPETPEDEFTLHHACATCRDCKFLEVDDDKRRKWFPCQYADYGESNIDSPACEQFYKQAIALMRKEAGR